MENKEIKLMPSHTTGYNRISLLDKTTGVDEMMFVVDNIRTNKHISNPIDIVFPTVTAVDSPLKTILLLAEEYKNSKETDYNKELLKDFLIWLSKSLPNGLEGKYE